MINKRLPAEVIVSMFLVVLILVPYLQMLNHDFVSFDDDKYVIENYHLSEGFTRKSITWAFTFTDNTYWHPLTWLSHMLDCQLYGLRPGMHHLTNLLLHIANSLLLFLILQRMTGALWKSAFVAALFALHPLNVDSVAWVSERKNVLSAFFWMLTMLTYAHYSERPGFLRYLVTLLAFTLGLMAKPTIATLPFVLLLLDYWPLGRIRFGHLGSNPNGKADESIVSGYQGSLIFRLFLEKVPFLVLSFVSIYLSSLAIQRLGILISTESVPMQLRIANALVSYVHYIGKMVWPQNLAVFYPYPDMVPMWQPVGAFLFLAGVSVLVIRAMLRKPYLVIGWLWYLGTLIPVTGLVQAGLWPAMADRYAYIPLIGLFIIIAWGVTDISENRYSQRISLSLSAAILLSVLTICTWLQIKHWQNSFTLFKHALHVTNKNYIAHNTMGNELSRQGKIDEAITHYSNALRIKPEYSKVHYNLGIALCRQGKIEEAINHYSNALRIKPEFAEAHHNLGNALLRQGRIDEAISHYSNALRIKPAYAKAHHNLGNALFQQGRIDEAISHYSNALQIKPAYAEAHNTMGNVLSRQGRLEVAIAHYSNALRIKPEFAEAHHNLGNALCRQGKIDEAITHYSNALRIKPNFKEARKALQILMEKADKVHNPSKTIKNP